MAEYLFYGTKQGLTEFSSKTTHLSQSFDIRNNNSVMELLGRSFYSLGFNADGCVFSKYTLLLDAPRSFGFGFLGIDLFVSSAKKIESIVDLLDGLMSEYVSSYVKENGINNNDPGDIVKEDFFFADKLISMHSETNRLVAETSFVSGSANSSYFVYHSLDELKRYFAEPFRSEYKNYKRVFFVDNQDLLQVIKCDKTTELTGKVDMENLLYTVKNTESSKCDQETLHKNDSLRITWFKKYYETKSESGSLDSLVSKGVVRIDKEKRVVEVLDPTLSKISKEIRVSVVDYSGKPVKATITYQNSYGGEKKPISGNRIKLEGEDAECFTNFKVYIEGMDSEYKVEKGGYPLNDPETIIQLDKEKKLSMSFATPEFVLENQSLDKQLSVEVNAKIDDKTYVYSTKCYADQLKKNIVLNEQRDSAYSTAKGTKGKASDKGKEAKNNSKTADMKWLIVAIVSGVLLSAGAFVLGDYLDCNLFNSHAKHKTEKVQKEKESESGAVETSLPVVDANSDSIAVEQPAPAESKSESKPVEKSVPEEKAKTAPSTADNKPATENNASAKPEKSVLNYKKGEDKTLDGFWEIKDEVGLDKFEREIGNNSKYKELKKVIENGEFKKFPQKIHARQSKTIKELLDEMRK